MDNKDICNAFDSLTVPDEITKQKILKSIVNKEKKKNFRYKNFALPAAAAFMIAVNAVLIYNSAASSPTGSSMYVYTETYVSEIQTTAITSDDIICNSVSAAEADSERVFFNDTVSDIKPANTEITSETYTPNCWENIPETDVSTCIAEAENDIADKIQGELLPPVSSELQELFSGAYDLYRQLTASDIFCKEQNENGEYNTDENDIIIDGRIYRPINEAYFSTMLEMEVCCKYYFTDSFISRLDLASKYIEYDGRLYALETDRSRTEGYSGHVYRISSQSENEIDIKVICYIAKDLKNASDELFFSEPDNPEDYDIIERSIVFKKENGIWFIDDISLMW